MNAPLSVSVVINTDGRAAILENTLRSLYYLRYPRFEVVVVAGPSRDGTHEMLAARAGHIKIGYCPDRNISRSRNIGVEISSGEFIAFLDDDEIPEPEWLDDLMPALADPTVGVATGFLYDHTGKAFQSRYETVNRFGEADGSWGRATPEFNFPLSFNVPHAMINSPFRRRAIVDVAGFDEEYEYYLDETDMIVRMVDNGWRVEQLDRGFVHHKFLSNATRNERRIQTSWYTIIKNRAYFALMNGGRFATMSRILAEVEGFVDTLRHNVGIEIGEHTLSPRDLERFEREADQGWRDGLARGLRGTRQLGDPARLQGDRDGFRPFPTLLPAARQRCFVLLSAGYPPAPPPNGVARYVHHLARGIAALGHHVHVLTRGEDEDRIDFEDGVWVHRLIPREFAPLRTPSGAVLPHAVWNHSMTMLAEARELASHRPIDCVHAPLWGAEAIAFLNDGRWPLLVSTRSSLARHLADNPDLAADREFMQGFAEPMLWAERELLAKSTGLLLHDRAAVAAIEHLHSLRLDPARLHIAPPGLEDESGLPGTLPPGAADALRLLFVGRLEPGKGIGDLLEIAPDLLAEYPRLRLDIVGGEAAFEPARRDWRGRCGGDPARVAFHGRVTDDRLRGFYAAADIVVVPSRSPECPLTAIEAMMFGKPVVAYRSGGIAEIVADGRTGLLAEPGNAASLRAAIDRLLREPDLRRRLGETGHSEFLARFGAAPMAAGEAGFLAAAAGSRAAGALGRPEAAIAAK